MKFTIKNGVLVPYEPSLPTRPELDQNADTSAPQDRHSYGGARIEIDPADPSTWIAQDGKARCIPDRRSAQADQGYLTDMTARDAAVLNAIGNRYGCYRCRTPRAGSMNGQWPWEMIGPDDGAVLVPICYPCARKAIEMPASNEYGHGPAGCMICDTAPGLACVHTKEAMARAAANEVPLPDHPSSYSKGSDKKCPCEGDYCTDPACDWTDDDRITREADIAYARATNEALSAQKVAQEKCYACDDGANDGGDNCTVCGGTGYIAQKVAQEEWNPNDLVSDRRDQGREDPTAAELATDRERFYAAQKVAKEQRIQSGGEQGERGSQALFDSAMAVDGFVAAVTDKSPGPPVASSTSSTSLVPSNDASSGPIVPLGRRPVRHQPHIQAALDALKSTPGVACSSCNIAGECPKFQDGASCAFQPLLDALAVSDPGSHEAFLEFIISEEQGRLFRAYLQEKVAAGGQNDPRTSALADRVVRLLDHHRSIINAPPPAPVRFSASVQTPQGSVDVQASGPAGGGLIAKLFSAAMDDAPTDEMVSEPARGTPKAPGGAPIDVVVEEPEPKKDPWGGL
jgi:hypothetical protein